MFFLSVLHVISEGILDFGAMQTYSPKTPGVPVKPGEVLLSRINPRIPRVLVVPELGRPILCSTEFEVMRAKREIDPYQIAFLLLSKSVQAQIQSLTSGTSASHNRIRTKDLARVTLPVPSSGTVAARRLKRKLGEYRQVLARMMEAQKQMVELRASEMDWLVSQQARRSN
jgi:hypothetical protein